jgi:hypothetical protein
MADGVWLWGLVLLLMLFMSLGLIVLAAYMYLHRRRYGESEFRMKAVPGVVGGQLAGVVFVPRRVEPPNGFRAILRCKKNKDYRFLWQDERVIDGPLAKLDGGTAVPLVFQIPSSCEPTSIENRVCWQLTVAAKVPGVNYRVMFEVPIFKTVFDRHNNANQVVALNPADEESYNR